MPTDRYPLGLIVEGQTEYQLPRVVWNGIVATHSSLPVLVAKGNGDIRRNLENLLCRLTLTQNPQSVLVCLDLRDAIREGFCTQCTELRARLQNRADAWLEGLPPNYPCRPDRVVVVIQIPTVEAWLAADSTGLQEVAGAIPERCLHGCRDVDSELPHPTRWLGEALSGGYAKGASAAQRILVKSHPVRMAAVSRSFRKFWKETLVCFQDWSAKSGVPLQLIEPPDDK